MSDSRNVKINLIKNSFNQEEIIDISKNDLDWQVRRVAVENILDENVLKDIVRCELTSAVSIKAMEMINDNQFLVDICLNHPDSYLRLACLNRISDESLLSKNDLSSLLETMILNDSDFHVLKSVCENPNLDNQDILIEAAKSSIDEVIKREVIKKITVEEVLIDFALNDDDVFIRREAILNPNLKNLDAISKIIQTDDDDFNRTMAIYKIPDKDALLEVIFKKPLFHRLCQVAQNTNFSLEDYFLNILKNEKDEYKRQVAVNFISDESVLEDIILNESNNHIRSDAIKNNNFRNQKILDELISSESSAEILLEVVSKIENQELLKDYIMDNLDYDSIIVKAISRVNDMIFLKGLLNASDSRIRLETVRRICEIEHNRYLLYDIALTESDAEVCLAAINAMNVRNDLIEVANHRTEKEIRMSALKCIKPKRLLDNYLLTSNQNSLTDLPFEEALKSMALNDYDVDIRKTATSKLNDKKILDEIALGNDVNSGEAQKRLNSLFEDIKCIKDEKILNKLVSSSDRDVSGIALRQLEDLSSWSKRIAQVNEITDIDVLKDIALNDFNYLVRSEAEGRLEKILFNIRLDEIGNDINQEKLKSIVCDESFSLDIRRKALLKVTDDVFINAFENKLC